MLSQKAINTSDSLDDSNRQECQNVELHLALVPRPLNTIGAVHAIDAAALHSLNIIIIDTLAKDLRECREASHRVSRASRAFPGSVDTVREYTQPVSVC